MPLEETKPGAEFMLANQGDPTTHQTLIFPHVETTTDADGTVSETKVDGVSFYDVLDALIARANAIRNESCGSEISSVVTNLKSAKDWLDLAKTRGLTAV